MKASLVVLEGYLEGTEIPLSGERFLIGRGRDCQMRPSSSQISRHHCEFRVVNGAVKITDMQSTNGTFVNGSRINGELELRAGDRVKVGPIVFTLKIDITRTGAARTEETSDDVMEWFAQAADHERGSGSSTDTQLPDDLAEQLLAKELSSSGKANFRKNEKFDKAAARASELLNRLNKVIRKKKDD